MNEALKAGLVVPLMEEFYTIQGEGYHKGSAAYFVRIGGCDVGCHWCDVKESWDAEKHPPTEISTIINNAKQYSDTIVVTGGEPLMWNMSLLTAGLRNENLATHIETSGAYPLSDWDGFAFLKKRMLPQPIFYSRRRTQMIVYNQNDFFCQNKRRKYNPIAIIFTT